MRARKKTLQEPSSFRDPSGFIFRSRGQIYRQINLVYQENYDYLISSGLYKRLIEKKLLVAHQRTSVKPYRKSEAYKVIKPTRIPFISYPYEWCFSQLKDAALATLRVQKIALNHGMILKDASSYNIQFLGGYPTLIDTLSFEKYRKGAPWQGYRQFCQHYVAPLALAAYKDVRLMKLLGVFVDGIPLDFAARLLPAVSLVNFRILLHIHFHALSQSRFRYKKGIQRDISKNTIYNLTNNLEFLIQNLSMKSAQGEWAFYSTQSSYSLRAQKDKERIVRKYLKVIKPSQVWDLGSNTGHYSRLAEKMGAEVVSIDSDQASVEANYRSLKDKNITNVLSLWVDIANPSPSIGWGNKERPSLINRGPADCVMLLALLHHLRINNNIPLMLVANLLSKLGEWLIIEFIPKEDSQIRKMLSTRKDVFIDYSQESFEKVFKKYFKINSVENILGSERILYLMKIK